MQLYAFFIFLLVYTTIGAPLIEPREYPRDNIDAVNAVKDSSLQTVDQPIELNFGLKATLVDDDVIDSWNENNTANRIALYYVCPHPRNIATVFNAQAVWDAFMQGTDFQRRPFDERPYWNGITYPDYLYLPNYHAPIVDLGDADEFQLRMFPLNPQVAGAWPGPPGQRRRTPPGDYRVVFDTNNMFAGVAVIFTGEPGVGERLVWCYPMMDYGDRFVGATAVGYLGVDEAWRDNYDNRHYLYAPDPFGGSHPPP
ncbi:hypothetical protein M426DRAFT_115303 [Hypoxylon sp. CI-4A]|nr:hypothetical protein M426DRAFT_115303 [Hypoxylon sp. CI-4A]